MAEQLDEAWQFQLEQLRYIEEQLAAKPLPPDSLQLIQSHRVVGSRVRDEHLAPLGPEPEAHEEKEAWRKRREEVEHQVEAKLAAVREEEGLSEVWAIWCEQEKLRNLKQELLAQQQQHHQMTGMVQAPVSGYAPVPETHQASAQGMGEQMNPLLHPEHQYGMKMDSNGGAPGSEAVAHPGWEQQHQHYHIAPIGPDGQMVWTNGQDPHQQYHIHQQQHLHNQQVMMPPGASLPLKLCRRCNVSKPVSEFYRSKANSDGYDGRCKTCDAVQCAERRKRKQRVEAPTVEWKACRRCQVSKPCTDFYRNKTNPDGLYNNCKACFAADASARRERMAPLEQRTVPTKVCKRCKIAKQASDFYKNKLMSDGLYSHCKECYSAAATERSAGRTPAESKECRRCKELKPATDFYNSKMTADGLQSYCKQCYALAASQRRSKLQQEQGMLHPQDVQMGMDEQMALAAGHMGPHMGGGQLSSGPMDDPHMGSHASHAMQPQMGQAQPIGQAQPLGQPQQHMHPHMQHHMHHQMDQAQLSQGTHMVHPQTQQQPQMGQPPPDGLQMQPLLGQSEQQHVGHVDHVQHVDHAQHIDHSQHVQPQMVQGQQMEPQMVQASHAMHPQPGQAQVSGQAREQMGELGCNPLDDPHMASHVLQAMQPQIGQPQVMGQTQLNFSQPMPPADNLQMQPQISQVEQQHVQQVDHGGHVDPSQHVDHAQHVDHSQHVQPQMVQGQQMESQMVQAQMAQQHMSEPMALGMVQPMVGGQMGGHPMSMLHMGAHTMGMQQVPPSSMVASMGIMHPHMLQMQMHQQATMGLQMQHHPHQLQMQHPQQQQQQLVASAALGPPQMVAHPAESPSMV